jgi:hypothetical protein
MKIWKASFAAALLVLPVSFGAFAATTVYPAPTTPAYGSYNPSNPGYGVPQAYQGQVPGQVQQYYNNIMAPPGTAPPGQQQQQGAGMYGNNSGQAQPAVQYHYKNPNPNLGSIPDDQLPQRLFHNIPPHYYGALGD